MTTLQKFSLFFLRVSLGWLFLYAGIKQIGNPAWSAAGYLKAAGTFPAFFKMLADSDILPVINFINEWGLLFLGVALILGIFVRLSSVFGIILMFLYYLAALKFPYPNTHSFIVDEHIIYILALLALVSFRAGRILGLAKFIKFRSWLD